jgi:hypothetical protein
MREGSSGDAMKLQNRVDDKGVFGCEVQYIWKRSVKASSSHMVGRVVGLSLKETENPEHGHRRSYAYHL